MAEAVKAAAIRAVDAPDLSAPASAAPALLARLASAFSKMTALKPEEAEGLADGDLNGDAAKEEGERYFALIASQVRRNLDVSNTIPEAEQRTLKAELSMRVSAAGVPSDVRIKKGSGNSLFDDAVLSAVKKAAPFSPPPEHLRKLLQGGVTLQFEPGGH